MIGSSFKGKLVKLANKVIDGEVVTEFVIQHNATGFHQDFLDSFSEEFNNDVSDCLKSTEWKNIAFDTSNVHLQLVFDEQEEMKMPCELTGIKVTNKEQKEDEDEFTYSLSFTKILNSNIDPVFATSYLKRKEEDDDGKMKVQTYEVLLTK